MASSFSPPTDEQDDDKKSSSSSDGPPVSAIKFSLESPGNHLSATNGGNHQNVQIGPVENSSPRAFRKSHSIFKIPEFLTRNKHNSYDYKPIIVSIGPYHLAKQELQSIQERKKCFENFFVSRAENVSRDDLVRKVALKEQDIRNSYSEDLSWITSEVLIDMMILDGCFLLTLFLTVAKEFEYVDPIFSLPWVLSSIQRDLLLLENQLPLFVLQTLLETAQFPSTICVTTIALKFFSYSFEKPRQRRAVPNTCEAKHLLDLVRNTIIPSSRQTTVSSSQESGTNAPSAVPSASLESGTNVPSAVPSASLESGTNAPSAVPSASLESGTNAPLEPNDSLKLILSAKKLRNSGIKFKLKTNMVDMTFLDISLNRGKLQIPELILDDFISLLILNGIAFEQFCADIPNHVTSYAMFMGCLINNERDAALLEEEGIIQNYYGTENDVSLFFKRITKDYAFDIKSSYLRPVFVGVNEYTANGFHVHWAGFKYTYCGSLWIAVSSLAAFFLLLLTVFQVIYAAGLLKPISKGRNGNQG